MAPGGAILVIALFMVSSSGADQIMTLVYKGKVGYFYNKSSGRANFRILRKIADYFALLLLTQGIEPNPGPADQAFTGNSEVQKKRESVENIRDTSTATSEDPNPMTKTCLDIYRAKMGSAMTEPFATTEYTDMVSGAPSLVRGLAGLKTTLDLSEPRPLATSTPIASPRGMSEKESMVYIHDLSAIKVALPSLVASINAPSIVYKPQHSDSDKFNFTTYAKMDKYLDTCTRGAMPRGRKSYDDSFLENSHTGVLIGERLKKRLRQEEKTQREKRKIDESQTKASQTKARMHRQESQEEGYNLTPRQVKKRIAQLKRLLARKQIFDEEPMWVPVVRLVPHPSPNPCDDDDDDDDIMDRSFTPSGIVFHDTPGMAYLAALAESQDKEWKGKYIDTVEEIYGLSMFYQATSDNSNEESVQDIQEVYTPDERNNKGPFYDDIKLEYMDLFSEKKRKEEESGDKKYFDGKDTAKVAANKIENTNGIVNFLRRLFS